MQTIKTFKRDVPFEVLKQEKMLHSVFCVQFILCLDALSCSKTFCKHPFSKSSFCKENWYYSLTLWPEIQGLLSSNQGSYKKP